jgi:putative tricarboxylic transport membrane protein
MIEPILSGLYQVVQWPAIGFLGLGVMLGMYFGAMPGLSGLVGMAILLPFTFTMEPVPAFAFLLGMFAVTTTSDTISSVLLGIPGTAASQATILDGYPLAQQGQAARALGAAFTVSAAGGVIGAVVLALSIPIVRPLILSFGVAEFFMLGVLGLTMVGSLSGGSALYGLVAALVGVFLATIGYSPNGAVPRFTFDQLYLFEGLSLVPLVLGLFALPEILELAIRNGAISRVKADQVEGGIRRGMMDAVRNWWLVVRCSVIGVYVGMLPGMGAAVVDWIAYGHVVQTSKDKTKFGKGDIRGVIAPEAANNAMKGGALIPTIAFAIPGTPAMAILLGAFFIQGLEPGQQMLTTRLDITFSMVWTVVIANLLGAGLLLLWTGPISRITFIRGHLIVPAIAMFVFMGAWMTGNNMGDWVVMLGFGVLGYLMKQGGIPRPPLVLGFVLAPIMEDSLFLTTQYFGPLGWLGRPIVLVLVVLIVATLAGTMWAAARARRRSVAPGAATSAPLRALLTIAMLAIFFAVFGGGALRALDWSRGVAMFPLVAAIPGAALALLGLAVALHRYRAAIRVGRKPVDATVTTEMRRTAGFFAWLLAIPAVTILAGQQVAIPLFILAYLRVWGGYGWRLAVVYAAVGWGFLYVLFDQLIGVVWYPSWLL